MSMITALSGSRAFIDAMPIKVLSMGLACAGVIVCCAVYHATPAASATQIPLRTPAVPAPTLAFMTFVDGAEAEPPPWPANFAQVENPPVVIARAAQVPAVGARASAVVGHSLPVARRLIPHAVSLAVSRDRPAVAILWNP